MRYLTFVLLFVTIAWACTKTENTSPETVPVKVDISMESSRLSADPLFQSLLSFDSKIDQTIIVDPDLRQEDFETLVKKVNQSQLSNKEIVQMFTQTGLRNMDKALEIFAAKKKVADQLVAKYGYMSRLSREDLRSLMAIAVSKAKPERTRGINLEDECSDAYAAGMHSCETTFAIEAAIVSVGAAGASIAGTPLAGAGVFSGGMAAATAHYLGCRSGVVSAWQVCRKYHPV